VAAGVGDEVFALLIPERVSSDELSTFVTVESLESLATAEEPIGV
jgi:hypothetical protein